MAQLKDDQPIFLQIAELIETNILEQSLQVGERVPSTNEIAKHYQINPATAAKGVNLLVDEGILFKKRGVGTFAAENARDIILERKRNQFKEQYVIPIIEEVKRIENYLEQIVKLQKEGINKENRNKKSS